MKYLQRLMNLLNRVGLLESMHIICIIRGLSTRILFLVHNILLQYILLVGWMYDSGRNRGSKTGGISAEADESSQSGRILLQGCYFLVQPEYYII